MPTVPRPTPTIDGSLRVLRIIDAALIFAALLYAWLPQGLFQPATQQLDRHIYYALSVVAVVEVSVAFVIRNRMLSGVFESLGTEPADPNLHRRWRAASVVSYALALSVVVYGLVLRVMGATFAQATPFYAVGLALLVLWWPRRP